jgi:hypothetical protein
MPRCLLFVYLFLVTLETEPVPAASFLGHWLCIVESSQDSLSLLA